MDNTGHDRREARELQMKEADPGSAPPDRPTDGAVDEPGHDGQDAQDLQVNDLDSSSALPNRPQEGGDKKHGDPLIQLLQRLNKDHGTIKTAKRLGVDRKTVWRALQAGRLTPWLRNGLEREQQAAKVAEEQEAAGGEPLELELRVEGLERRLQDVEEQLTSGLGRMGEDLASLREEVKTLAWTGTSSTGSESDSTASPLRSPHRTYPQVVTVEALPDDERVFGEAMPLVAEWREERARFKTHWPSVEGLGAEVRMLELELELIEERRLTLPPGQLPWEWDQRRREARRREQRLGTARSNLRRVRWRRRLLGVLSSGLPAR